MAAEATYGHISTWDTSGVTDMSYLFCGASWQSRCNTAPFNEDIGAWDTSRVTTMYRMFWEASVFNQDIGGWAIQSVTTMGYIFFNAAAFNQDLGWCVDDGVSLGYDNSGIRGTQCWSTSCGVHQGICDYRMTDSKIGTAVSVWLSNPTTAEAMYGHISTWDTSLVTDMSYLFCGASGSSYCNTNAASFNEDIAAWDTSGVRSMYYMFYYAESFDQDLGWCVDDDVNLNNAFDDTPCESTYCGVKRCLSDSNIYTAVRAWLADATAAEATYGHISTWATEGVTDMSYLFMERPLFNEDISAWDTSGVTSMQAMFQKASAFDQPIGDWRVDQVTSMSSMFGGASAFDQPIGDWRVDQVTSMSSMFDGASAFNQDLSGWAVHSATNMNFLFYQASAFNQSLGWCVDADVAMSHAFYNTTCESTSCGVVRCPTKENDKEQTPVAVIAGVTLAALLLAVGAFWFYRRRKASMADKADEPSGFLPKSNPEPTVLPPPEKRTRPKEEQTTAVAPEAEESPQETLTEEAPPPSPPTKSWFWRGEPKPEPEEAEEAGAEEPPPPPAKGWFAEPEGEAESPPFAPEAEDAVAAAERPPPPGSWFGRAAPEPEPEFEPEPEA